MSKVFVRDLQIGEVYTFDYWLNSGKGIVQYLGPFQMRYDSGKTWKKHRFLWIKKPRQAQGESVVTLYGENVRGTIRKYNEKR